MLIFFLHGKHNLKILNENKIILEKKI
jgi:hypothetical protein